MEVVYAVLLAWGFAKIAQEFNFDWSKYVTATFICGFVLIRFFFAPTHNLRSIAERTKEKPFCQRIIFFFDIPILIIHSLIYYRMCFYVSNLNFPKFYEVFFLYLLGFNVVWLLSINVRIFFGWGERKTPRKFWVWIVNNIFHAIAYLLIFCIPLKPYPNENIIYIIISSIRNFNYSLPLLAFSNCAIDLIFTAPYYLGFESRNDKVNAII
jgi:hypothetical protein